MEREPFENTTGVYDTFSVHSYGNIPHDSNGEDELAKFP